MVSSDIFSFYADALAQMRGGVPGCTIEYLVDPWNSVTIPRLWCSGESSHVTLVRDMLPSIPEFTAWRLDERVTQSDEVPLALLDEQSGDLTKMYVRFIAPRTYTVNVFIHRRAGVDVMRSFPTIFLYSFVYGLYVGVYTASRRYHYRCSTEYPFLYEADQDSCIEVVRGERCQLRIRGRKPENGLGSLPRLECLP